MRTWAVLLTDKVYVLFCLTTEVGGYFWKLFLMFEKMAEQSPKFMKVAKE
ncbi:hypothetical protein LINPERHAP1_LOCUS37854 [Linum perenne]